MINENEQPVDGNNDFANQHFDQVDLEQEPESDMPDGIGISYEDLAVLFAMKHETTVAKNDPILLVATVCNAFLTKTKELHKQHNEALTKIMTSRTQEYITAVQKTTGAFADTLSQASVEAISKIFDKHSAELHAAKWNNRWCTLIVAVSALANLMVLAWK